MCAAEIQRTDIADVPPEALTIMGRFGLPDK
jgi:hypothetical protein